MDPVIFSRLAALAEERLVGAEPAHDYLHVQRVVANVRKIAGSVDPRTRDIALVAALLHELVNLPKDHPESHRSGDLCALEAEKLLGGSDLSMPVAAAIRDHAFSKGVVPSALATKILQDADRLDALGAIGLARMWATCATMKRPLYDPADPFCATREPDDKAWGLDHVYKKLLRVPERLHTDAAKMIARERVAYMTATLEQLRSELRD